MRGLSAFRVVDFSSWIAGPYASKLFADAGADVIKVESVQGDPMRRHASSAEFLRKRPGDSAFFQYLNASKRSVTGRTADPAIRELIASADLLIEDFHDDSEEFRALDIQGLRKEFPRLVILSMTPFGHGGPYASRAATEFTIQAECGSIGMRGLSTEEPYMAGGRTTDFLGATYGAVAALATLGGVQRHGHGEHIDFSLAEVMNIASTIFLDLVFSLMGRPHIPGPFRNLEVPSIEPTKDGWVGFTTSSRQQFNDFLVMIDKGEWLGDEELASHWSRQFRMQEWNEAVRAWTTQRTTQEIIDLAVLFRIPVAQVNNGKTVLEHEQFRARGVFEKNPAGDFLQPRPPYRLNGGRIREPSAAPGLGEHSGRIEPRKPRSAGNAAVDLPLKGIRVLDATAWWAGPAATQMMATLGADVIHLESIQRFDGLRGVVAMPGGDAWWEKGHVWNGVNTNKRGLTLDLNQPEGLALLKELIGHCDVVIENFSPRVFENFGLTWELVQELNPQAVFVRMPAFGLDGPWRDYVGFAQTMEQMSGLAWLTGHVADQPRIQRGPCDPLSGMHAAFAILTALAERDASGQGQFLECTMVEGALNVAAEQVVEYTAYGNIMHREGNRSPYAAPQGLYPCAAVAPEENHLALSVANDAQWNSLVEVMGNPAWAGDVKFASHEGRRAHHDEIDHHLKAWAQQQDVNVLVDRLQAKRVPAARLADARSSFNHPPFVARHFYEEIDHPVIGKHPIAGTPFRFSSRYNHGWITRPSPTLGQHNHEVLQGVLGLAADRIAELERKQVIGQTPANL